MPRRNTGKAVASSSRSNADSSGEDVPQQRTPLNAIHVTRRGEAMLRDVVSQRPILEEVAFVRDNSQLWGGFYELIEERGWDRLIAAPNQINCSIVREFYSNFGDANDNGEVYIRRRWVDFSEAAIADYFHLPPFDGHDDVRQLETYEGLEQLEEINEVVATRGVEWTWTNDGSKPRSLKRGLLNDKARTWMKFIDNRIHPNKNSGTIPYPRICMLYCLLTNRSVNVARAIRRYLQNNTTSCGLPSMITDFARRARVQQNTHDDLRQPIGTFVSDRVSYLLSRGKRRASEASGSQAGRHAEQAAEEQELEEHPPTAVHSDLASLEQRIQRMELEQRQHVMEQRQHTMAQGHYMTAHFGALAQHLGSFFPAGQTAAFPYAPPPAYDAFYASMWPQQPAPPPPHTTDPEDPHAMEEDPSNIY